MKLLLSEEEIWAILGSPTDWKAQTMDFLLEAKPLQKPKPVVIDSKYGLVAQAQLKHIFNLDMKTTSEVIVRLEAHLGKLFLKEMAK